MITYKINIWIDEDSKYGPCFGDCLGVLNGTHISVYVSYITQILYQNWEGFFSYNVLATVTFDLWYCYILPGREELIHDSQVLIDKVQNEEFVVLEEKYFLANTGCWNSDYVMISY